ncbi:MAG: EamA family transporter [Pseudorhodoplanes sp.]
MIPLWAVVTIAAAFLQNLRNLLHRRIKEHLSLGGATFSRFAFAAPMAVLYLLALSIVHEEPLPAPSSLYFGYAAVGALAQILANVALLASFRYRNFVVATTFSKTEAGQTAVISALWLREAPGPVAAIGIAVSFFGVLILSAARGAMSVRALLVAWLDKPALLGLCAGFFLALASIAIRASILELPSGGPMLRAALTLAVITTMQLSGLGLYLALREPGMLMQVARSFRPALGVGSASAATSALWFTAGALENMSHVRALGQIELIFAFLTSWLVFREHTTRAELLGIGVMVLGLLVVILGT